MEHNNLRSTTNGSPTLWVLPTFARMLMQARAAVAVLMLSSSISYAATPLTKSLVASGLSQPVFVTAAPGDTSRLFVVERGGAIKIIKNGSVLSRPFLNCSSLLTAGGSEQGLLGLAFHPQFLSNRYFYVNYTRKSDGATIVSRFERSVGDSDSAALLSESVLVVISQPFSNHNGGMIAFSPIDNYFYIGMGDGGSGGDPSNRAQDSTSLLGKILRIDVDKANGTLIPNSNPFVGRPGWRGEIWARGVRNPWRFSFDPLNGDMYIGDVGQGSWEEISFQSGASSGGENYGWRLKEGLHCYNPSTNCDPGGLTDPLHEYSHAGSRCSITGGYVYRGCAIPDLGGTYFFGDYCSGNIYSFVKTAGGIGTVTDRTAELASGGLNIASFGQDAKGELYIVTLSGVIYKIVPNGVPSQCSIGPCCSGNRGNVNSSGIVDLSDLSALVSYLTGGGYLLPCFDEANVNAAGIVDLSDLSYLVSYLTGGTAVLPLCA